MNKKELAEFTELSTKLINASQTAQDIAVKVKNYPSQEHKDSLEKAENIEQEAIENISLWLEGYKK